MIFLEIIIILLIVIILFTLNNIRKQLDNIDDDIYYSIERHKKDIVTILNNILSSNIKQNTAINNLYPILRSNKAKKSNKKINNTNNQQTQND